MICTFFGHRNTYADISDLLEKTIVDCIEKKGVRSFYVGNNGAFDRMVLHALKHLKTKYPFIQYAVVLAYLPTEQIEEPTLFPEGLETVPRRFAIDRRNRWMVEQADYVITYVVADYGGAAKFQALAQRKGKTIINLAHSRAGEMRNDKC